MVKKELITIGLAFIVVLGLASFITTTAYTIIKLNEDNKSHNVLVEKNLHSNIHDNYILKANWEDEVI